MFAVRFTFTTAACGSGSLWSGGDKNGVKKGVQEVVEMRLISNIRFILASECCILQW